MPFVLAVISEYVVEIGKVVADRVDLLSRETYSAFAVENPEFIERTRSRIVTYWDYYYRSMPFEEYPAYRVLSAMGLWDARSARRLLRRR